MQITLTPNKLDCPLRLSYECASGERECKNCITGVYELVPAEAFKALVVAAGEALVEISSPVIRDMCTCDPDVGWICRTCSCESDLRAALAALKVKL